VWSACDVEIPLTVIDATVINLVRLLFKIDYLYCLKEMQSYGNWTDRVEHVSRCRLTSNCSLDIQIIDDCISRIISSGFDVMTQSDQPLSC